jgi:hypothetical protein
MKQTLRVSMLAAIAGLVLFTYGCKKDLNSGPGVNQNGKDQLSKKPQYVYLIGYSLPDKEIKAYNTQTKKFTTLAKVDDPVANLHTMDHQNGIYFFTTPGNYGQINSVKGVDIHTGQIVNTTWGKDMYSLEYNPNDGKLYGQVTDFSKDESYFGSMDIGHTGTKMIASPNYFSNSASTAFDATNNRYVALLNDNATGSISHIKLIDPATGNVTSSFWPKIILFDFNPNDGKLYGWKTDYKTLVSMDLSTGTVTDVSTTDFGTNMNMSGVIDPLNNIFYVYFEPSVIKGISLKTGQLVHTQSVPAYFMNWEVYVTDKPLEKGN